MEGNSSIAVHVFSKEPIMFKHILFPTDGSPASSAAILECMKFAQEAGARVTALHVLRNTMPSPSIPPSLGIRGTTICVRPKPKAWPCWLPPPTPRGT
ncbi:universal stress protein [Pseudoduganella sp. UC29_106]|uniref:universal stress protein n=1 Tax=Pseudoduganella sp. UC29_106 TaxID=3374553 RepID=UPI00375721A8